MINYCKKVQIQFRSSFLLVLEQVNVADNCRHNVLCLPTQCTVLTTVLFFSSADIWA